MENQDSMDNYLLVYTLQLSKIICLSQKKRINLPNSRRWIVCKAKRKMCCTSKVQKMGNFPTQPPPELYKYSPNLPHIHLSKVSLHLFHNIQISLFLLFLIKSRQSFICFLSNIQT
ncbi:unnamed protein product, partial [Vitis vinifera]